MYLNSFPTGATSPWYPAGTSEPCLVEAWAQIDAEADIIWALQHPDWQAEEEEARYAERLADDIADREDNLAAAGLAAWEDLN